MIHLHVHTAQDSFLDSTNTPKEIARKAKELGMKAVAITGHGYVSSHIDFYKACKKEGVKPILGCELYVCDDISSRDSDKRYDHLIVLAKNKVGYKNLLKIVSLGFSKGFYYKPRVDMKLLEKYKEGLIVATACLGGEIPRMVLAKKSTKAIEYRVRKYANIFEDFYLEVQPAKNSHQKRVNIVLSQISKKTGVPLVATSDVHFLNKEDFELHGVFIQINQNRDNEVYRDCYFKTEKETMKILTDHIGFHSALEAIANTYEIADKCNLEIELGKSYLPDFPIPASFKSQDEYLWHLIKLGFKERRLNRLAKHKQKGYWYRIKEEYRVITKKGYSGYFLIVRDIIKTCHEHNIATGDGRGSADNSLICYVVGITNVDSIKYDLNFSRFLTMERKSLPDIDMDISSKQKKLVIELLKKKYGENRVAQICTFSSLQARACIDAIGKVLGLSYLETTEIKKYIPDQTTLKEALNVGSELKEKQKKHPKLFDYVLRLEGIVRGISVHAGGVVILPSGMEMCDFTAIALSKDKEKITQLEMNNIEEVGLVKFDVLGISTLDVVSDTLKLIGKDLDYLDVATLDFNDEKTYKLLQSGETDGVFQLESTGMKDACKRVVPGSMEDIIAILALYRPDTMGELDHYIERKHGREEITYLHKDLIPILEKTYGCMIYQEQIMAITKKFAGYNDGEADGFRKGIGKKDKSLVRKLAQDFRKRTLKNKYPNEVTNKLSDDLEEKGGYMFNKGHASGYAILTYKTAYLKANHPIEFMSALISNQKKQTGSTDYDSIGLYIMKCLEMGIQIKSPDVNNSDIEFTPHDGSILYGLGLIKGVGDSALSIIMSNRPYKSFEDFLERFGTEKKAVTSLIKSGAFDFTNRSRKELLESFREVRFNKGLGTEKPIMNINVNHIKYLLNNKLIKSHEANNKEYCTKVLNEHRRVKDLELWREKVLEGNEYSWEFETLSYHLKNDILVDETLRWSNYKDGFYHAKLCGTVILIKEVKVKKGKSKGKTMAFYEFATQEGVREGVAFPEVYSRLKDRLKKGSMVVVRGKKENNKCIVNGAMDIMKWKELKQ